LEFQKFSIFEKRNNINLTKIFIKNQIDENIKSEDFNIFIFDAQGNIIFKDKNLKFIERTYFLKKIIDEPFARYIYLFSCFGLLDLTLEIYSIKYDIIYGQIIERLDDFVLVKCALNLKERKYQFRKFQKEIFDNSLESKYIEIYCIAERGEIVYFSKSSKNNLDYLFEVRKEFKSNVSDDFLKGV
jgi:hypothetical protein